MRHIYRYTEQAKKYLSAVIKTKMPKAEPWLHVAVKTWSNRNPWSGIVVFVWDTRKVIFEHRFNKSFNITNEMMRVGNSGMQRAVDNREPLVGGRKDCNEFFEFGDFDASHSQAFDGKDRIRFTDMYKRRSAKSVPKPGTEANANEQTTSIRRLYNSSIARLVGIQRDLLDAAANIDEKLKHVGNIKIARQSEENAAMLDNISMARQVFAETSRQIDKVVKRFSK